MLFRFSSISLLIVLAATVVTAYDLTKANILLRQTICSNQLATCDTICNRQTMGNNCTIDTMQFQCVCKDGRAPNDTQVTFPVPFFQCQGSLEECLGQCSGNDECRTKCESEFKCGNLDPSVMKNVTTPVPNSKKKRIYDEEDSGAGALRLSYSLQGVLVLLVGGGMSLI